MYVFTSYLQEISEQTQDKKCPSRTIGGKGYTLFPNQDRPSIFTCSVAVAVGAGDGAVGAAGDGAAAGIVAVVAVAAAAAAAGHNWRHSHSLRPT